MRKLNIDHDKRVAELLALVQLTGLGDRYPRQLSGGQRQRVALARALASNPRLLLLDEPFGALDAVVRKQLRTGLREIVRSVGVTTIIVTHDQEEAFDLADKVVVFNRWECGSRKWGTRERVLGEGGRGRGGFIPVPRTPRPPPGDCARAVCGRAGGAGAGVDALSAGTVKGVVQKERRYPLEIPELDNCLPNHHC